MLTEEEVPLFVDLDGTLVKSDLLFEGALALMKRSPWYVLAMVGWSLLGRERLKAEVARRSQLDTDLLPLHSELVQHLKSESTRGRAIYLATAADRTLAEPIARRIGVFTGILASDGQRNLRGDRKLGAILATTGGARFDYAGNALADLPIWARARRGILVNPDLGVSALAGMRCSIERVFDDRPPILLAWARQLRLYQWLKNLLLGVPVLTAHAFDLRSLTTILVAFLAFGCVASGGYVLNDLLDLTADRLHPRKFERPLAAGNLPLGLGVLSTVGLVGMGLALAALQSRALLLVLVAYLALSLGYSIYLKRLVLVDVVVLAALYTVRIIAGTVAIEVPLSSWLLAFSMFIFLSLALIKRSSELITVERMSRNATAGRDYRVEDRAVLTAMGVASGYIAIVVLALYIDSPEGRGAYGWPGLLWLACPTVLYWISRLWIKTARGEMHDDPLFFSLRDRASWIAFAAIVLVTLAAI